MLEEIDRVFQGDKTCPMTKKDFNSLKYCEVIAKEVAHLCPAIASFTRYIDKPDEVAGYKWPAGTMF